MGGASKTATRVPFRAGALVVITLRDPREKFWGVLREISPAGLSIRGLELGSLDDFAIQLRAGDSTNATDVFFPMQRVERMELDAPNGPLPSIRQRLRERSGKDAVSLFRGGQKCR